MSQVSRPSRLLDPGLCLTLRPMAYPTFFEMYRAAIKNTWTVEEVDFATDVADLRARMTDAERHLVQRLVAFFATGDSIVANNLVLNPTGTSTPPRRACTCRASSTRRRSTCSYT